MSVLIKGMEMPKTCEYCDLCTSDGDCIATGGDSLWDALPEGAEYFPTGWKYEGCPLVEVPAPHGRLIDADVLKQHIDKLPALPDGNFAGNHSALKALINMQPTVQSEIILCGECKHYKIDHPKSNGYHCCHRCHNIFPMKETDFCSRAERRTNG